MNVVVMVGGNDDEVLDFADYARRTGRTGSDIEYMPLDAAHAWERPLVLAGEEIVRRIVARSPLVAIPPPDTPLLRSGSASSTAAATSGVISTVTDPLCARCNRLRITAPLLTPRRGLRVLMGESRAGIGRADRDDAHALLAVAPTVLTPSPRPLRGTAVALGDLTPAESGPAITVPILRPSRHENPPNEPARDPGCFTSRCSGR